MQIVNVDLAIIGAGPAGLAAAIAAAKSGVSSMVLLDRQDEMGGILPQCIHHGFGLRYFKEELTGPEYAWRFIEQLAEYPQIKVKQKTMVIRLNGGRQVVATSSEEGLVCYQAKAVVLAMGCRERPRGALNIPGTRPSGIYTAGMIQRLMNIEGYRPGNTAVILGSGDIGLIMARRLTLEGIKVLAVLELLPYSSGLGRNIVQCLNDFQIPLLLSHTVAGIYGEKRLTGIDVVPVDVHRLPIPDKLFRMDCDILLLSVGLIPENELTRMAGVEMDPLTGGPWVDSTCQTSIPGIFACGNVLHVHDLVDDVSEEGKVAGTAAAEFLAGQALSSKKVKIKPGRNIRSIVPQELLTDRATTLYIRVSFPERDCTLWIGKNPIKQRIVSPGETIRYTVKPEDLDDISELKVSLEESRDKDG